MQWRCENCGSICTTSEEFLPPCPICGGQTHSYSEFERVKAEVRSHVNAMRRAVRDILYPDELYEVFLAHLTAALAAHGGAIWRLEEPGGADLCAFHGATDEWGGGAWQEHRELIASIRHSSTGQETLPPDRTDNPTDSLLLMQRVHPRCSLVIEVVQGRGLQPASIRGYICFLEQMAEELSRAKCIPWQ